MATGLKRTKALSSAGPKAHPGNFELDIAAVDCEELMTFSVPWLSCGVGCAFYSTDRGPFAAIFDRKRF